MGWSNNMCMCFHTGNPSIEKCKKARMKREETQELAALDVSNIIATQGNFLFFSWVFSSITKCLPDVVIFK